MLIVATALTAGAITLVLGLIISYRVVPYEKRVYVNAAYAARVQMSRRASNRTAA